MTGDAMAVGLKTRVREVALDTAQQAAIRLFAARGEKVAKLMTPAGLANPYPIYDELRAGPGIHEAKRFGVWLLASHALVSAAVRDDRLSVDNRLIAGNDIRPGEHFNDHEMILRMDPPDHTRIRRLVGKAFTPKAVAAMRPRIELVSDELLDGVGRSFDVVDDYAVPLTVRVICDILGVPDRDWRRFRSWGDDVTRTMGVNVSRADVRIAEAALGELAEFLVSHIRTKRVDPGPDLLSAMIAAKEEDGDRLTDRELLANTFLILLAGFETTVNLIGNGVVALMESRDQWERLCADSTLVPNAVEELLRFDSPVQFTGRNVPDDVHIGGFIVPKGKQLMLLLAAANHDPAVFDEPRRLDTTRANARDHVAFSSGPHYCLGASLARLEGEVAFRSLSTRLPSMQVSGRPARKRTDLLRGYQRISVDAAT
ncbi:MAG TPA: cytochrome P450 [Acidimicrobiales bacterium]|nr:cytochrome P450 [Acidimicrobiales bacterium]